MIIELRNFIGENKADKLPRILWDKIADECVFRSYIRCIAEVSHFFTQSCQIRLKMQKTKAKVGLTPTNVRPDAKGTERLEMITDSGVDVIEFSMDSADAETYAKLRPPTSGKDPRTIQERC